MAFINDQVIEGTRIIHRNFEGRAGQYNRQGDRSCSVVVSKEDADALAQIGWDVKMLPPKPDVEGSEALFYIPVRCNFDGDRPAKAFIVTEDRAGRTKITPLDKDSVGMIDHADIVYVDVSIHPSRWQMNGKSGVKAYLKEIYVRIREDVLASKYGKLSEEAEALPFEINDNEQ